ncbi:MAG TPA: ATP:cob(I)alamin adenosyltransferase [Ramlibacter sp.]|uniref:ATP:cob(I)alamin adenosyltransferase n=1 Tax=Ramlibacter sp. TaxID=1917967 RepID=UPI002BB93244|nr:ATP:cob(I)alamin adenosyltransferase [Ramlibacter sp.]HVZ45933.1 ATP:cob(I)alamin adenosyltransferase [Ramlibacter sp.]
MGTRLGGVYMFTGDDGSTALGDGLRVQKNHERVEACGCVEELSCAIGIVTAMPSLPQPVADCLLRIQDDLATVAAELRVPARATIVRADVARIEQELDAFDAQRAATGASIAPAAAQSSAACLFARAVARRAERRLWTLVELEAQAPRGSVGHALGQESVNRETARYLNRLSDLLAVVAQVVARVDTGALDRWHHR